MTGNVDGLVLWRDLKNVCPVPMPIEILNMKLTTKSQIANVCRNYRPIAKKMPIVPMSCRHSTKPFVGCSFVHQD
jgi:hypothetical protein